MSEKRLFYSMKNKNFILNKLVFDFDLKNAIINSNDNNGSEIIDIYTDTESLN